MTRHLRTRSAALVATAALALTLTACSSGGDSVADFCESGEQAFADLDTSSASPDDPDAFAQALADLHEGFASVDAPDEIADDWAVFEDAFGGLDEKLQDIDTSDPAAITAALTEFSETASSDELTTASDNVGTFIQENCES